MRIHGTLRYAYTDETRSARLAVVTRAQTPRIAPPKLTCRWRRAAGGQLTSRWQRTTYPALAEALAPLGLPEPPRDLERRRDLQRKARSAYRAALGGATRPILITLAVAAIHVAALHFIFFPIGG